MFIQIREKTILFLIAEIKRNNKDKDSAIKHQLEPACIKQSCEYGVYYDGVENVFFRKADNWVTEYSLLQLPPWGYSFTNTPLKYNDLIEIKNINEIINKIEQILYNLGATKEEKYKEFFKFILAKYFDEKDKYNTGKTLDFQISNNTTETIRKLHSRAKSYYNENITVTNFSVNNSTIEKIVRLLQDYSFLKSRQDILQTLFMKFAQSTLKTELDQFYTPIDIVEFIISLLKIENMTKIIDPACGSADFLVGCLKKNIKSAENIYCWDKSPNALEVASLNMILNGDGRTNIQEMDSIKNSKEKNGTFDLVITNPPFGDKTIYEGTNKDIANYILFSKANYKQLGVLFIERAMNLLKNGGIMCIILPNGYMTNPNDKAIRKYLLDNFRIIAYISLPEGAFKGAGTGVKTGILIVKKEKFDKNYKIFTDVANNIGFNFKSKNLSPLYKRNIENGDYKLDKNNNKILLSDFPLIINRFKNFVYDNAISGFEEESTNEVYDFITKEDLQKDKKLVLRAETNQKKYTNIIVKIKNKDYLTLKNAIVTNKSSFSKNPKQEYCYIDIGELEKGNYLLSNKIYGWELPNRAKQSVSKYDIVIGKLKGSINKFCMILHDDTQNTILTNGCYKVTIEDELTRLSFYKFLMTNDYKIQMESLATGSIMPDIKESDVKDKLIFPKLTNSEITQMKDFIKQQEFFVKLRNNL